MRDAPPADDPLLGRVLAERFRLVARIAGGGVSAVYRAEAPGGAAAVKVADPLYRGLPELQERFAREAEVLALLDGRSAPRLFARGELEGRAWLAMELSVGAPLVERTRRAPLPPTEAIAIADAVLAALATVHALGVVHRDVKPANVLYDGERAVLLDFGAAQRRGEPAPEAALGTPAYAAPEQQRDAPVDARADLYAVGALLYELVAGGRPFRGDPVAVLRAHAETPAPPLPNAPPALAAAVARALEKDPARRFADAAAMRAALRAAKEAP